MVFPPDKSFPIGPDVMMAVDTLQLHRVLVCPASLSTKGKPPLAVPAAL